MDDTQDVNRQVEGEETQEQMTGMGIDPVAAEESGDSDAKESMARDDDPLSVKKRLGQQAKKHAREMRAMQEQLAHMQSQLSRGQGDRMPEFAPEHTNPYNSPGQPNGPTGSEEERIQKAVRYALEAKNAEERRAKEAESRAHVQKQYERLQSEFDKASDKYDDFDDVVLGHDVPFTPAMRDALLFIDNPADVAYKLGKNRSELQRISQLHPLDQAKEVTKLAFALMGGNSGKQSSAPRGGNPLNPARPNPATSNAVTDKTPPSTIRARMKAGTWK